MKPKAARKKGPESSDRVFKQLDQLASGTRGVVRNVAPGNALASRLAALGVAVNSQIEVLDNRGHGPLLILARDTRVALGRGEAKGIIVEMLSYE